MPSPQPTHLQSPSYAPVVCCAALSLVVCFQFYLLYRYTSWVMHDHDMHSVVWDNPTSYLQQLISYYLVCLDVPDVPEDPVAIQIRDMRYGRCFIPIMWKNTVNSVEARVTYYTLRVNGNFVSTETANLSSTVYYSKFLVTECANSHTIDISATNICGTTGRIIYRTHRQDQQCPTDTDTSTCIETEIPTLPPTVPTTVFTRIVSGTRPNGYSERNRGNCELLINIYYSQNLFSSQCSPPDRCLRCCGCYHIFSGLIVNIFQ